MYGLSPVATSSKVLKYQGKLEFFQPSTASKPPVAHLSSARDNYPVSQKPVFKRFSACLQAFSFAYIHEKPNKKPTQREFIERSRKIIYISLIYFFLVTLVTPLKITRYKTICHDIPRYETIYTCKMWPMARSFHGQKRRFLVTPCFWLALLEKPTLAVGI